MAGSDDVLDAAFRRAGVMRVNHISELFDMALVLAKQPEPRGPNLTIITNAGGPAVLATDATVLSGGELTKLADTTIETLSTFLPAAWSHSNPVDLIGDADAHRYSEAIKVLAEDENTDGLLVVLSPQDMTEPEKTAESLKPYADIPGKPILASYMGGQAVAGGAKILQESNIPCFDYPDAAAAAFARMWRHSYDLKGLYETPAVRDDISPKSCSTKHHQIKAIIDKALAEKRDLLTEMESKEVLKAYGLPVVETIIATSAQEAKAAAEVPSPTPSS